VKAADSLAVEVKNVCLTRQGNEILRGVSLSLPKGKCSALLGPNGCGKTTLTRLLTGNLYPTAGTVQVLGETIGATDVRKLRARIGLINPSSTSTQVVPVVDPRLSATRAVVTGLLGTAALHPADEKTLPSDAFDHARHHLEAVSMASHLNQSFGTLSTGEQRRVLIARAMIRKPELFILDEPTVGLDIHGREQVLATVDRVLKEPDPPTVLLITHHVEELPPDTAQTFLMRDGLITAGGPPEAVLTPEKLSDTFGCKVFVRREDGRWWLQVLPEAWIELLNNSN